jgi:hypothetical protein
MHLPNIVAETDQPADPMAVLVAEYRWIGAANGDVISSFCALHSPQKVNGGAVLNTNFKSNN